MENKNEKIKVFLSDPTEENNIIDSGLEFTPSERTIFASYNIENVWHPINRKKLVEFLGYIKGQLDELKALEKNSFYETTLYNVNQLPTETLKEIINNFDPENPEKDQIACASIFKVLVDRGWIKEGK